MCYEGGHVGNVASNNLNSKSIGICLIGDLNAHAPTTAQIIACKTLISYLVSLRNKNVYGIPVVVENLYGHSTVPYYVNGKLTDKSYPADDGCPGKYMPISEFSTLLTQPIQEIEPTIPIDDDENKESDETLFPKFYKYGGDSYINVRTASKNGTVLTRVVKDERVVVLQEKDGWFELVTIDAKEKIFKGWSLKTLFKDV
jgi:N-acetyl-anhydromuramyl-L-alanine amidase AmpD